MLPVHLLHFHWWFLTSESAWWRGTIASPINAWQKHLYWSHLVKQIYWIYSLTWKATMGSAFFCSRLHHLLYFEPTINRLSKRKSAWWLQAKKFGAMMSSFDWNWQSDFRNLHIFAVCVWVCACVYVPQRAFNAERGHMQGYKIGFRCVLKIHEEPAVPVRALALNVNV